MRLVPIECVKEGSFLAKTIYDDEGRILLREGIELTEPYLCRIKSLKIFSIYIIDEYSEKEIEDIIKPELRQKSIKQLKDTFKSIQRCLPTDGSNNKISTSAYAKENNSIFNGILDIATNLIEEILNKKNLLINLVDIKSMDNYTYQHSVNVAVLSLIIGIQLQLTKPELYELCIGSLIHDIGKVFIPKQIILKPDKLTKDEFETIKQHPEKGYSYLRKLNEISAVARIVILQHHERYDGKGYPEHKRGREIHKLARIAAIADVYDALTSDRPYRKPLNPSEAMEYIMASGNTHFDYEIVKAFSKVVIPYPEGSIVTLSTGEYAVVIEVFQIYPLRPTVKIIKSNDSLKLGTYVSLIENLHIVITGTEHNIT